jgi:hypothetical protein
VVEAWPLVAVGQLGVRGRWRLRVTAVGVLSKALDAVGVVTFDHTVFT